MLELTIYGLTGLAAMLVVAFCFAFADDFALARSTSSAETGPATVCSDSFQGDSGQGEVFHG